ncbi:hypothetical protein CVT24_005071 [Panaeolus cyanescens]|uniref:Uncharacterized protein n=1 Tax=Panaeolus cyanescens TaxID=181874 RepID=A0A409VPK1_9AGAR|nr:hypothetical protein CVT24_005071 [Panaeolus cyanescens]
MHDMRSKKYYKLFNQSRTAANNLYSVLDQFVTVIVPLAQNTNYPVERRVKSVKNAADKIAEAAEANAGPLDSGVDEVIRELNDLYEQVTEAEESFEKESKQVLEELSEKITKLAAKIKENGKLSDRLSAGSKEFLSRFKSKGSSFTSSNNEEDTEDEGEDDADKMTLNAAIEKLDSLDKEIKSKLAAIRRTGSDVQVLVEKCRGLVSKLGNFGVIWKKISNDATLLSEYITKNGLNEKTIVSKVVAESEVYEKIKRSLDEYTLRVD